MVEIKPPDYDELMGAVGEIQKWMVKKQTLKVEIDEMEANAVRTASTDRSLTPDGKFPSTAYINATVKITGMNNELTPKRREYAIVSANLEKAENLFKIMQMQFDHWRTEQANLRRSTF